MEVQAGCDGGKAFTLAEDGCIKSPDVVQWTDES